MAFGYVAEKRRAAAERIAAVLDEEHVTLADVEEIWQLVKHYLYVTR